jgi:Tfp pilus assembly protein PilN
VGNLGNDGKQVVMRAPPLQSTPKIHFGGQSPLWLRALGIVLLLLVACWIGYGFWQMGLQETQMDSLQQKLTQAEAELNKTPAKATNRPPVRTTSDTASLSDSVSWSPEQRRQINGVIRQLNTPWLDLFEQLERSTPKDVALISIEPDARRASLRLQAEAKTLDTLLTYADRLQNQNTLGQLTYSKHETNDQDPNKPIRLSVEYSLQRLTRLQSNTTSSGAQK